MELQKSRDMQFELVRYPALVQVWYKHNQMHLQSSAVIVGTALLFLAHIVVGKAVKFSGLAAWGYDNELRLVVGLPMALTGVDLLIILYLMRRARQIMGIIEDQINEMEQGRVEVTFKDINHASGRLGANFIWCFMLICLAITMLTCCTLFSFGILHSGFGLLVVLLLMSGVKLERSLESLCRNNAA